MTFSYRQIEGQNRTFSSFEIVKQLGIKRETLRDWVKWSYIEPETKASGKGTKSVFSRQNLYEIGVFIHLIDIGIPRETASSWVKEFRLVFELTEKKSQTPQFLILTRTDGKWSLEIEEMYTVMGEENVQGDLLLPSLFLLPNVEDVHVVNVGRIMDQIDRIIDG
jgi:hypothetical protein